MNGLSQQITRLSRSSVFLTNLVESLAKDKCRIICEVLVSSQLEILKLKRLNKETSINSIKDSIEASNKAIAALNACRKKEYKDANPKK
jgi:hypothetical protein